MELMCRNGEVVKVENILDGVGNCADRSDESEGYVVTLLRQALTNKHQPEQGGQVDRQRALTKFLGND